MQSPDNPYFLAQTGIVQLKAAIHLVLSKAPAAGLKNSEIGRLLGIYTGHVEHEGHIPRVCLALMEAEGVVEQDSATKLWRLRSIASLEGTEA